MPRGPEIIRDPSRDRLRPGVVPQLAMIALNGDLGWPAHPALFGSLILMVGTGLTIGRVMGQCMEPYLS